VFFVRHADASYQHYKNILSGDAPQAWFASRQQPDTDLTPTWIERASSQAKSFFDTHRDSLQAWLTSEDKQTEFVFVSSNEVRAVQTANIYKNVWESLWFAVAETIIHKKLWLNFDSVILYSVFNPTNSPVVWTINRDALDDDFLALYDKARSVILADDRWSFGSNFYAHAEEVQKYFASISTSKQLDIHQLKKLLVQASSLDKTYKDEWKKVVCFGHENYCLEYLGALDWKPHIWNSEVVSLQFWNVM